MINIFSKNKSKNINNIEDLMNLKQYKNLEDVKENGELLYEMKTHTFDVINKQDMTVQATVSYLYLQFKHLYSSLENASLTLSHSLDDGFTSVFTTADKMWTLEVDEVTQTIAIYPNISGFFDDKGKENISMCLLDLAEDDLAYLDELLESTD